jgi:hypothetical protein
MSKLYAIVIHSNTSKYFSRHLAAVEEDMSSLDRLVRIQLVVLSALKLFSLFTLL